MANLAFVMLQYDQPTYVSRDEDHPVNKSQPYIQGLRLKLERSLYACCICL